MCGISGFNGRFNGYELLNSMLDAISFRGKDGNGVWLDQKNNVGLCHSRLAIIDLSNNGKQPMFDNENRIAITFNGEIYNYKELRNELVSDGFVFQTNTDTEVLLNLYLKYKFEMLSKINGMFAFAIWDSINKHLFLSRDFAGVKPLFYTSTINGFMFSSSIKSLLVEKSIKKNIDINSLFSYLSYLYVPSPSTLIEDVFQMEPGQAMIVKNGIVINKWKWYELPVNKKQCSYSVNDACVALNNLFATSVKKQMVSDVPVGAFLSGGLDSSAMVSFAKNNVRGTFDCFTIANNYQDSSQERICEDLPYSYSVSNFLNVRLNVAHVNEKNFESLPDIIKTIGEPISDPAALMVKAICQLAKKAGVKVLLSGAGGDDIFSGYRRHHALNYLKFIGTLPINLRTFIKRNTGFVNSNPFYRRLNKFIENIDLSLDEQISLYHRWINSTRLFDVFSDNFKPQHTKSSIDSSLLSNTMIHKTPLQKALYLEQRFFLPDHNLAYTDRISLSEGVEVRVPFVDKDLFEFAWTLPDQLKYNGVTEKYIFRKAMEGILPHNVIYRPKTGFGFPLRDILHNSVLNYYDCYFSSDFLLNQGLFNPKKVKQLIHDDKCRNVDATYTIYAFLCFQIWYKEFIS